MAPENDIAMQKAWDGTCRVVFGRELGPLGDYGEWLSGYLPKRAKRKSHSSGKEVAVAMDEYPPEARFASADEVKINCDYALSINQLKDIDSLLAGLREKCEYAGNRHLGNSAFVGNSDVVLDSQHVQNSSNVEESQFVESSFMVRKGSKYVFGSGILGEGEFLVRVVDSYGQKRTFESSIVGFSSDCYFCHNVLSCREMMFCFGQRAKSYCIANTPLPREKYMLLKAKILSEVAERLRKEKSFPSLAELVPDGAFALPAISLPEKKAEENMAAIEKGFASAYRVLFGAEPGSIREYDEWLSRQNVRVSAVRTPFGQTAWVPRNLPLFCDYPEGRVVTMREALELGKHGAGGRVEGLESGIASLGSVAFFTPELADGRNTNLIGFPHAFNVSNAYRGHDGVNAEHIGLSSLALNAKYAYGCFRAIESQFVMKCCNSQHLNRCMEMDSCNKCSDSYFCHNSEALSDCMFCFSMKGRRHFVGNTELGKEKYSEVKPALVSQMADELRRKKSLGMSVFSLSRH